MLAVTWVSTNACMVEVGFDGQHARVLFVGDFPGESIAPNADVGCDVVALCGTTTLSREYMAKSRVIASEPVARLLSIIGFDEVERCQLNERVEVIHDVLAIPSYSGGIIGNCDWTLTVKGKCLLTICGSRGEGAAPPKTAKHVILLHEPVLQTPKIDLSMCSAPFALATIPDSTALGLLPLAWSIPRASMDALPLWCHQAHDLLERYVPSWGNLNIKLDLVGSHQGTCIVFVLESELELLQTVQHNFPVLSNLLNGDAIGWTPSDVRSALNSLSKQNIVVGPRWVHYQFDCAPGNTTECFDVGRTYILEGSSTMQRAVNHLLGAFTNITVKDLIIDGLTVKFSSEGYIEFFGKSHVRLNCTDASINARLSDGLRDLEDLDMEQNSASLSPPTLEFMRSKHSVPHASTETTIGSETDANPIPKKRERIPAESSEEVKRVKTPLEVNRLSQSTEMSETSVQGDVLREKLKARLIQAPRKRLTLSELAKSGEFGEKPKVMELVRKHPNYFEVSEEQGKRIIILI